VLRNPGKIMKYVTRFLRMQKRKTSV